VIFPKQLALILLFSGNTFAQIVINPVEVTAYGNQFKSFNAAPAGKILKFKGLKHPGFILEKKLGEGETTAVFSARKVGTTEKVALRLPLPLPGHEKPLYRFNSNLRASNDIIQYQNQAHRVLPIMTHIESTENFFATTRVLEKKNTPFTRFKAYIETDQRSDPRFMRMEKDFVTFVREVAEITHLGDFNEKQLFWEELGNEKGRWVIVDYAQELDNAIKVSPKSTDSIVDALFHDFKKGKPEVKQRLRSYGDQTKAILLKFRNDAPFYSQKRPNNLKPIAQVEGDNPLCGTDIDERDSALGRAAKRTLGNSGNALGLILNFTQFLPSQNPFAQANVKGVSCVDAKKNIGRMHCDWDEYFSPWNNVVECTVITEVYLTGEWGSSAFETKKEPICGVKYRWIGLRLDEGDARAAFKQKSYFSKEGAPFKEKSAEKFIADLKKEIKVNESSFKENLKFPVPSTEEI
jgi:hypothetical protein